MNVGTNDSNEPVDIRRIAEWGGLVGPVAMVHKSNGYAAFLDRKRQANEAFGFEPLWIPEWAFDFQQYLCDWSIRLGRCLVAADCGLGKTIIELIWSQNCVMKTNGRTLLATPLAVGQQIAREADRFGVEVYRSRDGKFPSTAKIVITNYEQLHKFDPADFTAFAGDESSILKNFAGKTKAIVTEFVRTIQYRLLCTATAAPNDYFELGTSSEALGYLGHQDMLTRFFKEDSKKDFLGWGRKTFRFRGHAEIPFWRWVCSWSRACRRPSDLGFDDTRFVLPQLIEREYVLECSEKRDGMLFALPARDLREQREERRQTLHKRCEVVAELAAEHQLEYPKSPSSVIWCHLNQEADLLEKMIPDALQVSGLMPTELKEERLLAFQSGEISKLITKPKIGCYGLNWQHCHNVLTFPSHSWEQYYQAVRRCYRFGQVNPVTVTIVTTEGELGVLKNLQRKAYQADRMFESLVRHVTDAMHIDRSTEFTEKERLPAWLS